MTQPFLEVQGLSKQFRLGNQILHAVKDVSFILNKGETLGLGGESGSGKSTVGKLLMRLLKPTTGSLYFEGQNLYEKKLLKNKEWRRKIQMIFQHPAASLNPRMTVRETLSEPLIIHHLNKGIDQQNHLISLLEQVGLTKDFLNRWPFELSGGQKQRIAIARALSVDPRLLICDEPFSALDVSVQAQIIHLLLKIQKEKNLSYLIISHDLSILRYLTQRLAIMYLGQFVEWGPTKEVYEDPLHPYSKKLISSVLSCDPFKEQKQTRVFITKKEGASTQTDSGCPFRAHCPLAMPICQTTQPKWREVKSNHFVACHLYQNSS